MCTDFVEVASSGGKATRLTHHDVSCYFFFFFDSRLGLGDFIFYSILVAKAALYSWTTFSACTLSIITGLGLTLLMLAVRGHALPALPISIFLGVVFYLITRYVVEPFVEQVFIEQTYV